MKNEHIARLIYAAHSEYNIIQGLGSRCRWEEADRPSRQAYISVVERTLLQPTKSSFDNHELWRASWEANGWKYGPVRDDVKKTHPALVPYAELPEDQRVKLELEIAIVRLFVPAP